MPHPPRNLTHDGETLPLSIWSKRFSIPVETLRCRLDTLGWTVERSLTTPVEKKFSRKGRPVALQARTAPIPRSVKGKDVLRFSVNGEEFYRTLGETGSLEAGQAYAEFAAEWYRTHGRPKQLGKRRPARTIADLVEAHLESDPKEPYAIQIAYAPLIEDYGTVRVADFRPIDLMDYMQGLVEDDYATSTINAAMWRVRSLFRWAELRELVPEGTYARYLAVKRLPPGSGSDKPKVEEVPAATVEKTLEYLREPWSTIVRAHRLIGCRSTEICGLRADEIDRKGDAWIWTVSPERNKNHWRGKILRYYLGPQVQELLDELLRFRPGGHVWRQRGSNKHLHHTSYATAIRRTCQRHGIGHWHPHQLRHLRANEIRRKYESSEAAAAAIGDTREVIESIYTDPVDSVRRRIALEFG